MQHFTSQPSLSGWLEVNRVHRYCELNEGILRICRSDSNDDVDLEIPVAEIYGTMPKISDSNPMFQLTTCNLPQLVFKASDSEEAKKWVVALSDPAFTSPIMLNEFDILYKIGQGYSGKVYLVRKLDTKQLFALKSINKKKLITSVSVQRAIAERNVYLQSSHPFIPRLYSAFQTDQHLYLVLEYIGGGDLEFHFQRGLSLSPTQIKLYLAEIILAMIHIHGLGIVYRDLKLANIMIACDGHLKVTDFGMAKDLINASKTTSLCGTHDYLAPETIEGEPYGFAVDWWALGVLAYRFIVGTMPFRNDNLSKLYDSITKCKYRMPRHISELDKSFITSLLQRDPEGRLNDQTIKNHPYFADIDWEKVYNKEYDMEFIPSVPYSENISNFDVFYYDDDNSSDSCSRSSESSLIVRNFSFSAEDDFLDFKDIVNTRKRANTEY